MNTPLKIAIIGTGAMGSIYAARLSNAGHSVCVIDVWADHVDAMNAGGLTIDGPKGRLQATNIRATRKLPSDETFDLYIIATKSFAVRPSAEAIAKTLTPDAMVLTIQNGLGTGDDVAAFVPKSQIILGVAEGFGASMIGPAHAAHTSMKQIRLGLMQGMEDQKLSRVADAWHDGGFHIEIYDDITQLIWEKLLCNVTLSGPCTAFGRNVAELRAQAAEWNIALSCMKEAYAIGMHLGINFSFDDPLRYVTEFADRVGTAKPSMLQDHEAQRASEIGTINGAILKLGNELNVPTPYNETICAVIRAREAQFD
jgi:2-dehydropantoate 2-reductase